MLTIMFDGIEYRFFNHLYAVSRCGKVLRKLQPYTPTKRKDGYLGIGRQRLMHRVVAACWCDKPENATHVHHIDENKSNNHADNLEWVTPKQHFSERHQGESGKYTRSEETRAKLRAFRTGKKDSSETKAAKIAILQSVRPQTTCSHNGVSYPSVSAAAKAIGIHPTTFRARCLSKNFPEYKLLKQFYS